MEPVRVSKRTAKIDTAEDSSPTLNEDDIEIDLPALRNAMYGVEGVSLI